MTEEKLKKVNNELYVKLYKGDDGTDGEIRYEKKLNLLWMTLKDMRLHHEYHRDFSINLPAFKAETVREYNKQEERYITAMGMLKDNPWTLINVIEEDGTIKDETFRELGIILRSTTEKEVGGSIYYVPNYSGLGLDAPNKVQVNIDFWISSEIFDNIYRELQEAEDKTVTLGVHVSVFESGMPYRYLVEENSSDWSGAYYYSLNVSWPVYKPAKKVLFDEGLKSDEPTDYGSLYRFTDYPKAFAAIINNLWSIGNNIVDIKHLFILTLILIILIALRIFKFL